MKLQLQQRPADRGWLSGALFQTHGTAHLPDPFVSWITYDAGRRVGSPGVTVSVNVWPRNTPENCAGGAGLILTGPTSMRYVPATSKVPSVRTIGCGNCPCPHPTTRSHPSDATERHAPSPVHRPAVKIESRDCVGVPAQSLCSRQMSPIATSRPNHHFLFSRSRR